MANRIKIVSNGSPAGTKVFLPDGSEIPMITEIKWSLIAGDVAKVQITLANVEVEAEGELDQGAATEGKQP